MWRRARSTVYVLHWLVTLSLVAAILAIGTCYMSLELKVLYARGQVEVISSMPDVARKGDARHAVDCLEYTLRYYPTDTKQPRGSPLDKIVEVVRRKAIDDIIAALREKSGKDFGPDPKLWLDNRMILEGRESRKTGHD